MTAVLSLPVLTGIVAALCTTLAFLPQLFKMRKEGSTALSPVMLGVYLAGMGLWLVYGLMIGSAPIVAANVASIVIVAVITARTIAAERASTAPRRLRIAIDMDEVMADALGEHIRRYNAAFGARLGPADLHGRHIEQWVPAAQREAVEAMLDSSFFADLAVMAGCQEAVRELAARHDVYIVTAAMDVPCSFDAKYRWLQRHFPFIPPANIVFCGDKHIVDADYLIDDRARHFERFKGRGLLFSAPHNAAETRYPRVHSWDEVREFFRRLEAPAPARVETPLRNEPAAA